jgi:hypothetical protein
MENGRGAGPGVPPLPKEYFFCYFKLRGISVDDSEDLISVLGTQRIQ